MKKTLLKMLLTVGLMAPVSAFAQNWGDLATSGNLTNGSICRTDGTDIICDDTSNLTVDATGKIGVSNTTPAVALDVSGTIRISNGGEVCNAGTEGGLRYVTATDVIEICNGTAWQALAVASNIQTDFIADADNDTKVQVEENADEDIIRFDTAGTERMVIAADGKLGIGVSEPSATLHLEGSAELGTGGYSVSLGQISNLPTIWSWDRNTSGHTDLSIRANAGTQLYLKNDGNVGIGLTNPDQKFEVAGPIIASGVVTAAQTAATALDYTAGQGRIIVYGPDAANAGGFEIFGQSNNSSVSHQFLDADGGTGFVGINKSGPTSELDVSGTTTTNTVRFRGVAGGAGSSTALTELDPKVATLTAGKFCTTDGSVINCTTDISANSLTDADADTLIQVEEGADDDTIRFDTAGSERMIIDNAGNIAINTATDAGYKLNVNGTIGGNGNASMFRIYPTPGGGYATYRTLSLSNNTNATLHLDHDNSVSRFGTDGGQSIAFATAGSTSAEERMRITNTGNVGIGITSPTQKFEVAGSILSKGVTTSSQASATALDYTAGSGRIIVYGPDASTVGNFQVHLQSSNSSVTHNHIIHASGATGYVGIKNPNPTVQLDVSGTIRVGNTGEACAAGTAGGIRYSSGNLEYCNGTAWGALASASGGGIALSMQDADTDTRIQVEESADDDTIRFDTAGAERMLIDATGNVGIGAAPHASFTLDVAGLIGGTSNTTKLKIFPTPNVAVHESLYLSNNRDASLRLNHEAGISRFGTDPGQGMAFATNGHTSGTERVRITSAGNVGIGITNPDQKFEVAGPIVTSGVVNAAQTSATVVDYTAGNGRVIVYGPDTSTAGNFQLHLQSSNASVARHLLQADGATGNIGINNTTPSVQLDVSGTIRIADGGEACAAGTAGGLRYNGGNMEFCNGTAWSQIAIGSSVFGGAINDLTDGSSDGSSVFLGANAGANDDGTSNTNVGIGINALNATTSGAGNTAVGSSTLAANVSGSGNIAVGSNTLAGNTSGHSNVAVGWSALQSNNTGRYNTAVGNNALNANTADGNTAVGHNSLDANTSGTGNVALGYNTLSTVTTTSQNTAIGYSVLGNSTAANNTAVGHESSRDNTTGTANVVMGREALRFNKTGSYNTILGTNAGTGVYAQDPNISNSVLVGYQAGSILETGGNNNTLLGYQAGDNITTGASNIMIGSGTDALAATTSNSLNIGNTIYGDLSTDKIGIGVTAPTVELDVSGTVKVSNMMQFGVHAGGAGSSTVIVESDPTISTLTAGKFCTTDGSVINCTADVSSNGVIDADGDTQIQVEESGDEDTIRFDTAGVERLVIDATGSVTNTIDSNGTFTIRTDGLNNSISNFKIAHERGSGSVSTATFKVGDGSTSNLNISTDNDSIILSPQSGTVGIGTSAPSNTLHIAAVGGSNGLRIDNDGTNDALLKIRNTANLAGQWIASVDGNGNTNQDAFIIANNDGANVRFLIDDNGNIGVGTTTPSSEFQVSGTITATSFIGDGSGITGLTADSVASDVSNNTLVGTNAGAVIAGGSDNTFLGKSAGEKVTTGYDNTLVGLGAGNELTTGYDNVFIGENAGQSREVAFQNVFIGTEAGFSGTNLGAGGTFIGYRAGYAASGADNTIIGKEAGYSNSSSYNTIMGARAGYNNSSSFNTFVGHHSGYYNTSGGNNVTLGAHAGRENTVGANNVLLGAGAGRNFEAAAADSANIAIGANALLGTNGSSTGIHNIALGYSTGASLTTGSSNILIGYDVDAPAATTSNHLNIGDTVFADLATDKVGIGIAAPTVELDVSGTVKVSNMVQLGMHAGGAGSSTAITESDPTIATLTAGKFCTTDGSVINCTSDAGTVNAINDLSDGITDNTSIFLGNNAGANDDGSNQNTAVGIGAMNANTSGISSVAFGQHALSSNTTAGANVAIGTEALRDNVTGSGNVAIGFQSLLNMDNATWSRNVAVGYVAGSTLTSGTRNILLGYDTQTPTATTSNHLNIGNTIYGDTSTDSVGIGIVAPTAALDVSGTVKVSNMVQLGVLAGGAGSSTAITETDPTIVTLTAGKFCTTDGSVINCTSDAGTVNAINDLTDGKTDATSVFLGTNAGASDDGTTNQAVAIGIRAMQTSTDSPDNVAIGFESMMNESGNNNTAVGFQSMRVNSGFQNTAVGVNALDNNTASYNVAIGKDALTGANTGNYNTAVGTAALNQNSSGSGNVAVGSSALFSNTTGGSYNTAVGHQSMYSGTSAVNNTASGYYGMRYVTTGSNNVATGYHALSFNKTGGGNVALGYQAGKGAVNATDVNSNVFVGNNAGLAVLTGADNNVFIGNSAGNSVTTGASNILIGSGVDTVSNTTSNSLNIGNTIYGDLSTDQIGIGIVSPTAALDVSGTAKATVFTATSDRTFKENITTLDSSLDKVANLRGVSFDWKKDNNRGFPEGKQVGLIAQEVKQVFPEMVEGKEGNMSVNYAAMVAPLIEAVKELKSQNEELRKRIETLEEK